MINVDIDPKLKIKLDPGILKKASRTALLEGDPGHKADMTLVITDDGQVRELNRQFREIYDTTDVLSFPSGEIDLDTGKPYLGDIIISYPRALNQALQAGHPVETELQLLVVHGVLHLLGFDHSNEIEKTQMWAVQEMALTKLGLPNIFILEDQG
ncbi:MAG: rRNA maturation RNase YbeY [Chloroflexi bacterium GWB2_49_20]|nr:MAG: rRNA maturation RNase YbeY [Chloroflexi bacterium GWB2_49_20]OGN79912.1 MAG: rRNA maturation RNase YbeY [Chloroflexi bacterium GWC2_49_37]OGN85553.1 MAG: rRNA maturation RNase YbeY [Chloroflexi bacterium GWD2_49_16]HBG74429.1 rRNA maturation RNase YbeY [Anaerolineae bacterium]HCC79604.1 rRNA maturation RNase YbeY [Anaerolineae bacterium]